MRGMDSTEGKRVNQTQSSRVLLSAAGHHELAADSQQLQALQGGEEEGDGALQQVQRHVAGGGTGTVGRGVRCMASRDMK